MRIKKWSYAVFLEYSVSFGLLCGLRGLFDHYKDNASSHTAQKTRQYLSEENVELLDHPPYSPDLRGLTISLLSRKLKTDCASISFCIHTCRDCTVGFSSKSSHFSHAEIEIFP
ncbi:unnamed protein product [Acanthoscelides obtectus]|uniref:Uncharacterized protein n=1 Tax=Acanthoscelides obtectus TaxID=200917 RepID=A0A9P0M650_ACAOB|nr:unnamed protein product [Acanthoscelides obtectus]CAK1664674.1 hypothetical protein AOBTE_LOCUS24409 [Acanthoscelides obtectus]